MRFRGADVCRWPWSIALALVLALSLARAYAAENKPMRWLFSGPGVIAAIAADTEVSASLNGARPFVMTRGQVPVGPPPWNAVPLVSFKSFGAIRKALEPGGLHPQVKGVMYDYEKWRFTPEEEQRDPAAYVNRAAELVHARGLLFLTAPAVNIVTAMEPTAGAKQLDETYLRLGIAVDAARYADVFDIQAQRFESDTKRYANFVHRAAAQARQVNPEVVVLAGVSTQPYGPRVTADDILGAIMATRDVVDGYWFNIPKPSQYSPHVTEFRPDIALDVLHRLAGQLR